MLGLASGSAALRSVRVRSADGDALRVRRGFERALAGVEWMPPGMPAGGILLVRRIAATAHGEAQLAFGERVSMELRRQAARARRPWLHGDAVDAEAVMFADEAELVACLVRDWLRGLLERHWWWRAVLTGSSPYAWIRREAMARGELLVPVIALLARIDEAIAFVKRLEPAHCAEVLAAVAQSHGVAIAAPDMDTMSPTKRGEARDIASTAGRGAVIVQERADAIHRLMREVPEAFVASLFPPQQRLLALTLGLARMPGVARTKRFAQALLMLGEAQSFERMSESLPAHGPRPLPPPGTSREGIEPSETRTREAPDSLHTAHAVDPRRPRRRRARATHVEAVPAAHAEALRIIPADARLLAETPPPPISRVADPSPQGAVKLFAGTPEDPAPQANALVQREGLVEALATPLRAIEPAPRVATRFGGLFYVLNAALALGFYGDFTAPLAKNLEISPWDWLALVGREWFGLEIRDDAVWKLLAELAGRPPEEEPDRDFHPPSGTWLAEHLATLRARLALAIDAREGDDVADLVCRYEAEIEISATAVHVHLGLRELALVIRIAGLDRDPGWIPAAGRAVYFHFDRGDA